MSHLVVGVFHDSKRAGEAVSELKQQGYANQVSVLAKDYKNDEANAHTVKEPVADGAIGGAAVGAAMAGLAALLAGATSIALPGVGLLVAGPLSTVLTSAAAGATAGGLVGALVDAGIPDNQAQKYQDEITAGHVIVAIDSEVGRAANVEQILANHGATEINRDHT